MTSPDVSPRRIRFGVFEVDFAFGELRKHGLRIRLQEQPLQVLRLLIERPGEMVTRTELRQALWSTDTFVGFDHGLNNAINRLREALGDSADNPRFIETVPRRGYRFIAPVSTTADMPPAARDATPAPVRPPEGEPIESGRPQADSTPDRARRPGMSRRNIGAVAALLLLAIVLSGIEFRGFRGRDPVAGDRPQIKSLMVLPLENLTGDPAQEYFVDGMTDALITDLARLGSLRVISRTSTMHYKGTRKPIPEIGRELHVDAVIEGTVARSGDRVRVNAQLVHAATDRHLWADAYERNLGDILMLENDVASAIASQVQAKVMPEERQLPTSVRPVNRQAYEAYLKGWYFSNKWSDEGFEKAGNYFRQSINLDPAYAPAYAGLAAYYGAMAVTNRMPAREAARKADENATKALKIDDTIAIAHALLGMGALLFRCDPGGAEKELNRARLLSPGDMGVLDYHSYYLLVTGRTDEAIAEKKRVLDSDPLSTITNAELGLYYVRAGRSDEAIEQLRKTLELDPNYVAAYARLGMAYANKGDYARAIVEYQKALLLDNTPFRRGVVGDLYARSGKTRDARETIRQLMDMSNRRYVSPTIVARIYARLGEQAQALKWLGKAQKDDEPPVSDAGFDSLRSDPRFKALEPRLKRNDSCVIL